MANNDSIKFHLKAYGLRSVAQDPQLSKAPSNREFGIQIEKLAKMAANFDKAFSVEPSGKSLKSWRKRRGANMHRLEIQSKRLDRLISLQLHELSEKQPDYNKKTVNSAAKGVTDHLNSRIHNITVSARKALLDGKAVTRLISKLQLSQ